MSKIKPLSRFKSEAEERDMSYQSLIKAWLAEDVENGGRRS